MVKLSIIFFSNTQGAYMNSADKKIIDELENKIAENPNYLDFLGANTKELSHGYHTYPAMMIPQISREMIELTLKHSDSTIESIYDPFAGSGTTLVEGINAGLKSFGNDINPLSILMTHAKTTAINPDTLSNFIETVFNQIDEHKKQFDNGHLELDIPSFPRIDFWFKESVIFDLQIIKDAIYSVENDNVKNFLLAAFTETVRYVSNTRNNEFKLYRMSPDKLEAWNPDVIAIFKKNVTSNEDGNTSLFNKVGDQTEATVKLGSSMQIDSLYPNESFDLLVTSPPYGDSGTTVAYGQFSRLSLQWLDLDPEVEENIIKLDRIMLGGKVIKELTPQEQLSILKSDTLTEIYNSIAAVDQKRALEVLQFYVDLDVVIEQSAKVMKHGSYQYWVVANRTVKGYQIPTDTIIAELFDKYDVIHLHDFYRNIPNKRMPKLNSPTNKKGQLVATMNRETIIMLRKL